VIFSRLGIPVYVVFDGDQRNGDTGPLNEALLRLAGETAVAFPPTSVRARMACAHNKLQDVVRSEIGETFAATLAAVATEFGYGQPSLAEKNPTVIAEVLKRCYQAGSRSPTLGAIVLALLQLLPGALGHLDSARRMPGQSSQGELFASENVEP